MTKEGSKRKLTDIGKSTWKILLIIWTGIYLNCALTLAVSGLSISLYVKLVTAFAITILLTRSKPLAYFSSRHYRPKA